MARCPPGLRSHPTPYSTDTQREPDENPQASAPDEILSVEPPSLAPPQMRPAGPAIKLHQVTFTSATLVVIIPHPYSKMYVLVQYNSYFSDVMTLKNKKETDAGQAAAHTEYTFCVTSLRNSRRFNHTCLTFTTRDPVPGDLAPSTSTTTHYIMTILGCLFGMVIVLGVAYYCLRKRRMQEEKQKSVKVKKTILEMRLWGGCGRRLCVHAAQKLGEPPCCPWSRRLPSPP